MSAGGAALSLDSDSERNAPAHYLALNSPPRWERCAVDAGLHRSSGLHWRSLRRRGGASERRLCGDGDLQQPSFLCTPSRPSPPRGGTHLALQCVHGVNHLRVRLERRQAVAESVVRSGQEGQRSARGDLYALRHGGPAVVPTHTPMCRNALRNTTAL